MNTKLIVSILVLVGGLLIATSARAQIAISDDGVTFPDGLEQTSAVIVPMNCPHGDSIVWDTNADSWVCETDLTPPPTYDICSNGPAGGFVFYLQPDSGDTHGLEAAPVDQSVDAVEWGCSSTTIAGADGTAIGTGMQNTIDILAGCAEVSIAARYADEYSLNGFDDWFLPSKDETAEMLRAYDEGVLCDFGSTHFWSSTEYSQHEAWFHSIVGGSFLPGHSDKGNLKRVRAVRAF